MIFILLCFRTFLGYKLGSNVGSNQPGSNVTGIDNELFFQMDADGNMRIDYHEVGDFVVAMKNDNVYNGTLTWVNNNEIHQVVGPFIGGAQAIFDVRKHFEIMDANGDGYIQQNEMVQDCPKAVCV